MYYGGTPEFIEADIFKQVIPIAESAVTPQDVPQYTTQDKYAKMLTRFCVEPRTRAEMMEHIGIKERAYFKKSILDPLLAKGVIKMTLPDKPTSKFPKYVAKKG